MGRLRGLLCAGLALIAAGLAGCSPVYETVYDYTAPPSTEGKLCASKCDQISNLCVQNCQLREDRCVAEARERGARDYEDYVRDQEAAGKPIEKNLSDFTSTGGCYSTTSCKRDCTTGFRQCFVGCGGSYTSREVCTAFCE